MNVIFTYSYTDIPKRERLEKFFGCSAYSGKDVDTSETGKREGKCKCSCSCQFILSPYNGYPDGLANDVLVMLDIQDNASAFIWELFMDFVKVNGIIKNYANIPEKERLSRFLDM